MDASRLAVCLTFVATALLRITSAHAVDIPPVEAFGSLPALSGVELSPDGKLLAWQQVSDASSSVVIFDLDAHTKKKTLAFNPAGKLRSLAWADNETLLITLSVFASYDSLQAADHFEMFRTYAADVNTGKAHLLLMGEGSRPLVTGASLLAWRLPKPKTVIMSTLDFSETRAKQQTGSHLAVGRKDAGWVARVFEVDTRTGNGSLLAEGTAFTLDWVVNRNGEAVARSEWEPASSLFTVLVKSGLGWKEVFREKGMGARELYGLTADEKALIISTVTAAGRSSLWMLPLDGSEGRPLFEDEAEDVSGISYDSVTRAPIVASLGGLQPRLRWLDKDAEQRFRRVAGAFKDKTVSIQGRSEDGKRVVACVESPSSPPVYYFVDFEKGTADIIGEAYPGLIDARLGEVRAIRYKARDGSMVPAYLTLPPGAEDKNLPLVVLPHGGPEARDDYAFHWVAQFLAVRGYAVLQPQFRGSTGFGDAWRLAGYRQWGGLMQDDVSDGVKAMTEQGIVDAARVCIVGASYGGYAALAGVAFTPELYRCAVSVNGVSDLPLMLVYQKDRAGAESNRLAYWRENIGLRTDPQVIAKSPLRAASNIQVPVMLLHAVNDTVVPLSQSQDMARELDKLKKKVSYVELAGEDHWLSQSSTRVQMLEELDKFLGEQLRKP